ncbi:hypothetical protein NFI96_019506 [Prochilodus magdalenae]|nr:hypothetical protein NFI96_019506 [Prochilodus magdalenae]
MVQDRLNHTWMNECRWMDGKVLLNSNFLQSRDETGILIRDRITSKGTSPGSETRTFPESFGETERRSVLMETSCLENGMPCQNGGGSSGGGRQPEEHAAKQVRFSSSAEEHDHEPEDEETSEIQRQIGPQLKLLPLNDQIRELQTIIRDKSTSRGDFVFCADRLFSRSTLNGDAFTAECCRLILVDETLVQKDQLSLPCCTVYTGTLTQIRSGMLRIRFIDYPYGIRLVVEEGLNQLPYSECTVTTPTGHKYDGVKFEKGNCGVSIMRSGEAMEQGLRDCCRSIRIGKILIQSDEETQKAKVYYAKFPPDISRRKVLLMYPILSTGNTVIEAVRVLTEHGLQAKHIILLSLFSTPHGKTDTQHILSDTSLSPPHDTSCPTRPSRRHPTHPSRLDPLAATQHILPNTALSPPPDTSSPTHPSRRHPTHPSQHGPPAATRHILSDTALSSDTFHPTFVSYPKHILSDTLLNVHPDTSSHTHCNLSPPHCQQNILSDTTSQPPPNTSRCPTRPSHRHRRVSFPLADTAPIRRHTPHIILPDTALSTATQQTSSPTRPSRRHPTHPPRHGPLAATRHILPDTALSPPPDTSSPTRPSRRHPTHPSQHGPPAATRHILPDTALSPPPDTSSPTRPSRRHPTHPARHGPLTATRHILSDTALSPPPDTSCPTRPSRRHPTHPARHGPLAATQHILPDTALSPPPDTSCPTRPSRRHPTHPSRHGPLTATRHILPDTALSPPPDTSFPTPDTSSPTHPSRHPTHPPRHGHLAATRHILPDTALSPPPDTSFPTPDTSFPTRPSRRHGPLTATRHILPDTSLSPPPDTSSPTRPSRRRPTQPLRHGPLTATTHILSDTALSPPPDTSSPTRPSRRHPTHPLRHGPLAATRHILSDTALSPPPHTSCARSIVQEFPEITILTTEVHPVAPTHFGQRYFGTD